MPTREVKQINSQESAVWMAWITEGSMKVKEAHATVRGSSDVFRAITQILQNGKV